jgi:acetate kinase
MDKKAAIVAINSGSSNIKFKLFTPTDPPLQLAKGKINGIGTDKTEFTVSYHGHNDISSTETSIDSIDKAAGLLINWIRQQENEYTITGIGHRVVQGGLKFSEPQPITSRFLQELKSIEYLAPLHLPDAMTIMDIFLQSFPGVVQIASFDTYFHRNMPFEARYIALPRPLWEKGVVRYGFHGLSSEYIMQLLQQDDPSVSKKKIIIAHLGSGCSMTAVKNNTSIDTTMGFTPASGLMMNTRPGDIDPGIVTYLLEKEKMDAADLTKLFNKQSGLKAVSGSGHSMEQLLKDEQRDSHAAEAIRLFCYQAKKYMGALAAVLEGLDILVFTGGIGENAAPVRERICSGLEFLGVNIDKELNNRSATEINIAGKPVSVRVLNTDEEFVIAQQVSRFLKHEHQNKEYGPSVGS